MTQRARGSKPILSMRNQTNLTAYGMLLPGLVVYSAFVVVPLAIGLWTSLHRWDGLSEMQWIGLDNYRFVARDKVFWLGMRHTLTYAIVVTAGKNVLGVALALLLNQRIRLRALFRTAAFIPMTFSFVVIGVLWSWIFNPIFGLLNHLLTEAGLSWMIQGWLSDPKIAFWSVMWVDVWKWTGFHMVLFLAGLQGIPKVLYEVAALDGAGAWKSFVHVTIPMLRNVAAVSIFMSLAGAFVSNYDVVFVMTGGGPFHSTEVALTWLVTTAFRFGSFGKANAMSMILVASVAVVGALQLWFMTRQSEVE